MEDPPEPLLELLPPPQKKHHQEDGRGTDKLKPAIELR
jgi:hypothetical protein